MKIYFELFWIFFKIGSFTLGRRYAMVPLIQNELLKKEMDRKGGVYKSAGIGSIFSRGVGNKYGSVCRL